MAADGQEWGEEAVQAMGVMEKRLKNTLPLYGNKESMNMNSMILTNIVGSPYFKEELINYKTFHEVIDEVYYKVSPSHSNLTSGFQVLNLAVCVCVCVCVCIWLCVCGVSSL